MNISKWLPCMVRQVRLESNAMHDTNTVQESATSEMCDSDTFFLCGVPFSYGSANFININNTS